MIPYTQLFDNLYVGNYAGGVSMIKDDLIPTHIISLIRTPKRAKDIYRDNNVIYIEHICDDSPNVDIVNHFKKIEQLIKFIVTTPQTVLLVNCMAGRSRSVSFIILILIKYHCYTFDEAFNFIQYRRDIGINRGFLEQLKKVT